MSAKVHIVMASDAGYRLDLEVAKMSMVESLSDPSGWSFTSLARTSALKREYATTSGLTRVRQWRF